MWDDHYTTSTPEADDLSKYMTGCLWDSLVLCYLASWQCLIDTHLKIHVIISTLQMTKSLRDKLNTKGSYTAYKQQSWTDIFNYFVVWFPWNNKYSLMNEGYIGEMKGTIPLSARFLSDHTSNECEDNPRNHSHLKWGGPLQSHEVYRYIPSWTLDLDCTYWISEQMF